MPFYIKDDRTADLVAQLARRAKSYSVGLKCVGETVFLPGNV